MDKQMLFFTLKYDLAILGVPTDFHLVLKPYSKSYNGRYNPNTREVILYMYEDAECTKLRPYEDVLKTAIHESTHHYLWYHDSTFVRVKGVMHPPKFIQIERFWRLKAKAYGLFSREVV